MIIRFPTEQLKILDVTGSKEVIKQNEGKLQAK